MRSKKTKIINIRVTEEEFRWINNVVEERGVDRSKYIIECIKSNSKWNQIYSCQGRQVIDNLNDAYFELKASSTEQIEPALDKLKEGLKELWQYLQ